MTANRTARDWAAALLIALALSCAHYLDASHTTPATTTAAGTP